jgi:hypothetical protein
MKLRHAVRGVPGTFLRPTLAESEAVERAEGTARAFEGVSRKETVFHRAFVGEVMSMVYAPFYRRAGDLRDAVLDRPLYRLPAEGGDLADTDDSSGWKVNFLSALCPNCGWDLPGGRKSVVLLCAKCEHAWGPGEGGFVPVVYGFSSEEGQGYNYLPFWKLQVAIDGLPLDSYADLVRLANLPVAVRREWEERRPSFWTPAFRVRPRVFLRLAKQLTTLPEGPETDTEVRRGEIHAVTLGSAAALQTVKLVLAELMVRRKDFYPLLPEVKVNVEEARLVFLPFAVQAGDFIHRRLRISVRRNSLRS